MKKTGMELLESYYAKVLENLFGNLKNAFELNNLWRSRQ